MQGALRKGRTSVPSLRRPVAQAAAISLAADWLVSKGVELRDEYEDEIKEGLAEWVQERFDALRAEIQEWRDTRPERRAARQKFRASQEGKSRDEKKAARKERRQAKRAARRES